MKGCVKLLQFGHLGQLFVIALPAICMGDSYRRDNSDSEQGHKTCVRLPECRFHVRLSFDFGARLSFSPHLLFAFTSYSENCGANL